MARTDVQKVKQAVRVACPVAGFEDEFHWIRPATRDLSTKVNKKSQVREYRRGQVVTETDTDLFNEHYLEAIWADWEHVGIVHDTGVIEDPAECTPANRIIVANNRPLDFLLWLQRTAEELAAQAQQETVAERENFRQSHDVPAPLPDAPL